MALTFAPLIRLNGGVLLLSVGVGVPTPTTFFQCLKITDGGAVYAVMDGIISHYANGLPFDINGRLVVSQTAVTRTDMGVPFTLNGAVAVGA